MPADHRNIVLFSDGTGNSSASFFKTNVRRLFEALDVADPADPVHPRQYAYYDDGVGSSRFRPLALIGGAFGYGLSRNVRDLYAALCRTYQPGDRIYAFGFSRGAFTIRVLVGLLMSQGIVRYDGDEEHLARNVRNAFRAYRRGRPNRPPVMRLASFVRQLFPAAGYDTSKNLGHPAAPGDEPVKIRFLGLWDTVDAYGLPFDELTFFVDRWIWPLTLRDAVLHQRVERACHALSLDDQRRTFTPRLWDESGEGQVAAPDDGPYRRRERISQVWFAGVHADLGGGYPDDSLAHTSLLWMTDHAERWGLRFMPAIRTQHDAIADESGFLHNSRRGLAGYYRYMPRDVKALIEQDQQGPCQPQVHVPLPKIHASVLRRVAVGTAGYAPLSLPADFEVVHVHGGAPPLHPIPPYDIVERRNSYLVSGVPADQKPTPEQLETQRTAFFNRRVHVWNWVWWRRVAYFSTLGATLALALMPLVKDASACVSYLCAASPLFLSLEFVLPSAASTWPRVFAAHPQTTAILLSVVGLGLVAGRWLEGRASDRMRRIWYTCTPTLSPPLSGGPVAAPENPPGFVNGVVEALRLLPAYRSLIWGLRWVALPGMAGLVSLYLLLGLFNLAAVSAWEAAGASCDASKGLPRLHPGEEETRPFLTQSRCHSMELVLQKGTTALLRLDIPGKLAPAPAEWADRDAPAGPNGIEPGAAPWYMPAFLPLRRHLDEPWFKLMVRVGERGSSVHALDWRSVRGADSVTRYQATLTTDRTGPLFLYVNDGAFIRPLKWIYDNNDGTADVRITVLSAEHP